MTGQGFLTKVHGFSLIPPTHQWLISGGRTRVGGGWQWISEADEDVSEYARASEGRALFSSDAQSCLLPKLQDSHKTRGINQNFTRKNETSGKMKHIHKSGS